MGSTEYQIKFVFHTQDTPHIVLDTQKKSKKPHVSSVGCECFVFVIMYDQAVISSMARCPLLSNCNASSVKQVKQCSVHFSCGD